MSTVKKIIKKQVIDVRGYVNVDTGEQLGSELSITSVNIENQSLRIVSSIHYFTVDAEALNYLINNLNNTEIGNVMKIASMSKGIMNIVVNNDDIPHTVDSLRIELDYSINQFKNLLDKLFRKNIIYLLKKYDKVLRRTNTIILLNPHLSRNKKAFHIDCLKYFEPLK